MEIDGTFIEDTYAEAFSMRAARVLVTADTERWAWIAADVMTLGFLSGAALVTFRGRRRSSTRA